MFCWVGRFTEDLSPTCERRHNIRGAATISRLRTRDPLSVELSVNTTGVPLVYLLRPPFFGLPARRTCLLIDIPGVRDSLNTILGISSIWRMKVPGSGSTISVSNYITFPDARSNLIDVPFSFPSTLPDTVLPATQEFPYHTVPGCASACLEKLIRSLKRRLAEERQFGFSCVGRYLRTLRSRMGPVILQSSRKISRA